MALFIQSIHSFISQYFTSMKVITDFVEVESNRRGEYIDITNQIEKIVEKSNIKNGIIVIHELHTTAALTIQENDGSIHEDTKEILEEIVPLNKRYRHSYEGNENATAHIKNQLLGSSIALPIINGRLALGTWQHIFLIELFEARKRKIAVCIVGE